MSLPEQRVETNSWGELSQDGGERRENLTDQQNTDRTSATSGWQLVWWKLWDKRRKDRGSSGNEREGEICKRVWEKWVDRHIVSGSRADLNGAVRQSRKRRSQKHPRDTCQPPRDARCETEKQSEGGRERGENWVKMIRQGRRRTHRTLTGKKRRPRDLPCNCETSEAEKFTFFKMH